MQTLTLYVATAAVFLGLDALALRFMIAPAFRDQLGDWVLDSPRFVPAAVFYLFYVVGVLVFVSLPALREGAVLQAFFMGALLGAVAYGTYEFTNFATLERWSWKLVLMDGTWGALLTGTSAAAGVWITRAIHS